MTHTLHRMGSKKSLCNDYIVQILTSKIANNDSRKRSALNISMVAKRGLYKSKTAKRVESLIKDILKKNPDTQEKIKKAFLRLPQAPTVLGDIELRIKKLALPSLVVFNEKMEMAAFLQQLKKIDIGSSVVVSGLFDDVIECLKKIDIFPHTVQFSLGVFGNTTFLPKREVLEITTMCGHHLISPCLVMKLVNDIEKGRIRPEKAIQLMSKQCICGAFNVTRAAKLLKSLVVSG